MRALIICPDCEGEGEHCRYCEGACTLIIDETEVRETDTVINRGLPDVEIKK